MIYLILKKKTQQHMYVRIFNVSSHRRTHVRSNTRSHVHNFTKMFMDDLITYNVSY